MFHTIFAAKDTEKSQKINQWSLDFISALSPILIYIAIDSIKYISNQIAIDIFILN